MTTMLFKAPEPNTSKELTDVHALCRKLRAGEDSPLVDDVVACLVRRLPPNEKAEVIASIAYRLVPENLSVSLSTNTASRCDVVVRLQPNQASVLYTLNAKYPMRASLHEIAVGLWGQEHRNREINSIRVLIVGLRRLLAPLNVGIINDMGRGYRLALQPMGV